MNGAWVVDASVIAKWYLTEEEGADRALSLFDELVSGRASLLAPSLCIYEVARAIQRAARRRRISPEQATEHLVRFLQVGLKIVHRPDVLPVAYRLSETYRCNFYDACYLALAELLGLRFVFADDKLERQLAGRVDYAVPLARFDLD